MDDKPIVSTPPQGEAPIPPTPAPAAPVYPGVGVTIAEYTDPANGCRVKLTYGSKGSIVETLTAPDGRITTTTHPKMPRQHLEFIKKA